MEEQKTTDPITDKTGDYIAASVIRGLYTKNALWPEPDWEKLYKEHPGVSKETIFGLREIYRAIPGQMPDVGCEQSVLEDETTQWQAFVRQVKDLFEKMPFDSMNKDEMLVYWAQFLIDYGVITKDGLFVHDGITLDHKSFTKQNAVSYFATINLWSAVCCQGSPFYKNKVEDSQFLMPKEERAPRGYRIFTWTARDMAEHPSVPAQPGQYVCFRTTSQSGKRYKGSLFAIPGGVFSSREDALQFCRERANPKNKEALGEPLSPLAKLQKMQRTGPDIRNGRDVTEEELCQTYHLGGIEFGKSLGKKERQDHLNHLYDALYDLSCVLQIPKEEIGIKGTLSFRIGIGTIKNSYGSHRVEADPTGNYSYRINKHVINLARSCNKGSLAHEYFHALDVAIGSQLTGTYSGCSFLYSSTDLRNYHGYASDPDQLPLCVAHVMDALGRRPVSAEERERSREGYQKNREVQIREYESSIRNHLCELLPDQKLSKEQRIERDQAIDQLLLSEDPGYLPAVTQNFEETIIPLYQSITGYTSVLCRFETNEQQKADDNLLQSAIYETAHMRAVKQCPIPSPVSTVPSTYLQNAKLLDERDNPSKTYFANPREMFARAGDAYVQDALNRLGRSNAYLCEASTEDKQSDRFPTGQEREASDQAYNLMMRDLRIRGLLSDHIQEPEMLEGVVMDDEHVPVPFVIQSVPESPGCYSYRIGGGQEYIIPTCHSMMDSVESILDDARKHYSRYLDVNRIMFTGSNLEPNPEHALPISQTKPLPPSQKQAASRDLER